MTAYIRVEYFVFIIVREQIIMRSHRLSCAVIRTALILLCLVTVSSHFLSRTLAKYILSAEGEDHAFVAKFDTTVIPKYPGVADPIQLSDASGNVSYKFNIDNRGSQVAVNCGIVVEFSDCYDGSDKIADVEDMFVNVKLNGSTYDERVLGQVTDGDARSVYYYFNDLEELAPGEKSGDYNLTFNIAPSFKKTSDTTLDDGTIYIDYSNRFPVKVYVHAEQID